ncbi:putative protein phosphatase [Amphibalanus amphitrite]|uniref:protein-serine/threonine phosphatase n=1 Tax=Amphibalanus amphitrite TaxID=1232801 RepID=A0A6A4V3E3_AMPAM|nr:putative protein phosphatase [Amphibalanus amphitrite]KAF0288334.1 putative protein phosphatase [Amphibalanus amphitrite]
MGAYLSQPCTKKVSSDGSSEYLSYGDSSMQGWRVSQEDAHNSLPELAPGCALFAVYDGHGGHEVATYAAQTLPAAIRDCPLYKAGKVRESLRRAFLEFDSSLTRPEIIDKLKVIAGREVESEDEEETDREVDELFQEAHMPLEELMARYQGDKPAAAAGGVAKLKGKGKEKPLSPFLRAKAGGSGAGSSSSGAGGSGSSSGEDGDVKKDLTAEIKDETSEEAKSETSKDTAAPETKAEVKSEPEADVKSDTTTTESNSESNSEIIKSEANSKSPVKADIKAEPTVKSESDSDSKTESKTNGTAAGGEPAVTSAAPGSPSTDDSKAGSGDTPACNGNGTASPTKSPRGKGGKGARPGSGKSPAPAGSVAAQSARPAAGRATRKMPERAAAEVYRDVLEGARKAREAGHDHVEDEEEEEEEDDDFSLEQSDSVDDDNDAEDDDSDEDEGEEEEEEEEDSEQDDDELGDEEEAGDDEDSDFMFNMKDEPGSDSGCTAVVALLHGRQLYVANIGDSRCVLSRSGRAVDMSDDHKPEDEPELQRIVNAGGKVTMDGRVNGGLNLSRAFGDHAYKADKNLPAEEQMISACPDIRCVTIEPGTDEFMVLACDGIWNSKKSQEVVDFVSERIRERGETQLSKICEELFDECLAPNTMGDGTGCDNMTCIIVRFLPSLAMVQSPPVVEDTSEDTKTDGKADEAADCKDSEADAPAEAASKAAGDDTSAAARPEPEGAPPEKRQRTE